MRRQVRAVCLGFVLSDRQDEFVFARFGAVLKSSCGSGSYGLFGFCFVI